MPDNEGKLTEDEAKRAVQWVTVQLKPIAGGDYKCPVCGWPKWIIADHLAKITAFVPNVGMMVGGSEYPQVQVICTSCGTTQFVNAVIAGVVKNQQQPSEVKGAENG